MFYQEVVMSKIDSKQALGGVSQNRCFVKKAFFLWKTSNLGIFFQ